MSIAALECEEDGCKRPAQARIREDGRSKNVCSTCAEEKLEDQQSTETPREVV